MKYRISSDKQASDMFINSLSGGGSHFMTCGFCGRDHYCPDSNMISKYEEEYDGYLENALAGKEKDPDGVYIHYDVDCVMAKDINGIAIVLECPCHGLVNYETFIWESRYDIHSYLTTRQDQENRWKEEELTINKLAGK
jgi:hypothetical protein